MAKDFVFTITTGRSGTEYLTELFRRNTPSAAIFHERVDFDSFGVHTPDLSHFMLFNSVGNVTKVREFWHQKLQADAETPQDWYIETSHMLAKAGLMENLDFLDGDGHTIHVVVLKRDWFSIFWSLLDRGEFRFMGGHTWLHWLDPRYFNQIVDSAPFMERGEWGCAMWYVTEVFVRAEYYKLLLAGHPAVRLHELDLEALATTAGAAAGLSAIGALPPGAAVELPPVMNERKGDSLGAEVKSRAREFYDECSVDASALAREYYDRGRRLGNGRLARGGR